MSSAPLLTALPKFKDYLLMKIPAVGFGRE